MKTFSSIYQFQSTEKTVLTLGTFDGVHLGHQKIIKKLLTYKKEHQAPAVLLTFFPHPRMVLQQHADIKLLNTIAERTELLEKTGIDHLIIHPFDYDFSRLTAQEFIEEVLVKHANIKGIIIGYDHRFGRNRTADINDLTAFGTVHGFEVMQISAKEIEQISISSTKIRHALTQGEVQTANNYLGYQYYITAKVVKGKQLGRQIGFRTANLFLEEDYKLIPKNGVYVVKSFLNNQWVFGMMNIGLNPTVDGTKQHLEVHFFNFETDVYDQTIRVHFLHMHREEQKFESVEALKQQLQTDKKNISNWLLKFEH